MKNKPKIIAEEMAVNYSEKATWKAKQNSFTAAFVWISEIIKKEKYGPRKEIISNKRGLYLKERSNVEQQEWSAILKTMK